MPGNINIVKHLEDFALYFSFPDKIMVCLRALYHNSCSVSLTYGKISSCFAIGLFDITTDMAKIRNSIPYKFSFFLLYGNSDKIMPYEQERDSFLWYTEKLPPYDQEINGKICSNTLLEFNLT